MRRLL